MAAQEVGDRRMQAWFRQMNNDSNRPVGGTWRDAILPALLLAGVCLVLTFTAGCSPAKSSTTKPRHTVARQITILPGHKVTVDLDKMSSGDCWYEVGYAEYKAGHSPKPGEIEVTQICPDSGPVPSTIQASR